MLEKRLTALVVLVWIIALVLNPLARAQDLPKVEPEVAWTFQTGAPIWGSSSSKDGIVYFGSTDSLVYALDVATGDLVWSVKTGGPIYASVKVHEDYLYAASDDGFVYKLALVDGAEIWRATGMTPTQFRASAAKRPIEHGRRSRPSASAVSE